MPKEWYDPHTINKVENEEERKRLFSIAVDRKPYFMRYVYPDLMKEYNTFTKKLSTKAMITVQRSLDDLLSDDNLNEKEQEFVDYFYRYAPVSMHDCVVNRICRKFEQKYTGILRKINSQSDFDYGILKYGVDYNNSQYYKIQKLYEKYRETSRQYYIESREGSADADIQRQVLTSVFRKDCDSICSNRKELADMILDMCYRKNSSKQFVWDICGSDIISNLLEKADYIITVPVRDEDGDITYCGEHFKLVEIKLNKEEV